MLIHNYGLHWKEADGDWEGRSMWGHHARNSSGQRGIYVLYDDAFRIVYVGQAGKGRDCLFNRIAAHRWDRLKDRWTRFSWFGVCPLKEVPPGSDDWVVDADAPIDTDVATSLNHIEAILIAAAEPPLNLQRGRFGEDVEEYRQTTRSDFVE